jgi:hypothetical protein
MATSITNTNGQWHIVTDVAIWIVIHDQSEIILSLHLGIGEHWIGREIEPLIFETETEYQNYLQTLKTE